MAGDWIPVRIWLHKEPEVLEISQATGRSVFEVRGLLEAFWGWMSEVTSDGHIMSAKCQHDVIMLVSAVGADEVFWRAVEQVGWLQLGDGIGMPRFEKWLSKGGKRRLMNAQYKRLERLKDRKETSRREASACPKNVSKVSAQLLTREEKRIDDDDEYTGTPTQRGAKRDDPRASVDAWNRIAAKHGRPTIQGLNQDRRAKVRARLKERPDFWARVLEEFDNLNAWARGQAFLTFDWVICPTNAAKLLDGNFREKSAVSSPPPESEAELEARWRETHPSYDINGKVIP